MKNRTYKKIVLAGLFAIAFSPSCTDLDEEVFSAVPADEFFQSEEETIAALGEAYTNLYSYMGNTNVFPLQEVTSDEMVVPTRGTDWDDGGNWRRLHLHEYTFADDRIRDGWNFCYRGISTCNRLIAQFEELEVAGLETFRAELRAFRAFYYYLLLDMYGNVPIVTGFADADPSPATNSRQEVYSFVEAELVESLPNLSRDPQATYGRVNYYVAQAVLAKLYLNSGVYKGTGTPTSEDLQRAVAAADTIINSGNYNLTDSYFDNFGTANAFSPEFIFTIPYDEVFAQGFNIAQMTLHYGDQAGYNLQEQPWNGFCSLQEFYESYEEEDVRIDNFLVGPQFTVTGDRIIDEAAQDPDGPPLTYTPEINELAPQAYRQAGARVGKYEIALGATANLSNDFAIFRYSDILLMKAEALWRLGNSGSEALMLINQIRGRAGVEPFTELTEDNILAERGREMFAEAYRRQDLIRFGRYTDAWEFKPPSSAEKIIFPVPQEQLQANPNLVQNPGYQSGSGG